MWTTSRRRGTGNGWWVEGGGRVVKQLANVNRLEFKVTQLIVAYALITTGYLVVAAHSISSSVAKSPTSTSASSSGCCGGERPDEAPVQSQPVQ